MPYWQTFSFHQ